MSADLLHSRRTRTSEQLMPTDLNLDNNVAAEVCVATSGFWQHLRGDSLVEYTTVLWKQAVTETKHRWRSVCLVSYQTKHRCRCMCLDSKKHDVDSVQWVNERSSLWP